MDGGTKHTTMRWAKCKCRQEGVPRFLSTSSLVGETWKRPGQMPRTASSVAAAAVPLWEVERRFDTWEIYTCARTYLHLHV